MLEKRDFIDFDLHSRSLQWSMQQEGPPCLSKDSFAYRYAGFGTHEWVIYYDLVRQMLWSAASSGHLRKLRRDPKILEAEVSRLEELAKKWLEESQPDYSGRVPAILLESERKRLPIAMNPKDMIVDPDCPACIMMADEASMGMGPGFWHLDGSHMEDDFAFSEFQSKAEWEEEQRRYKEFHEQWEREWAEQELSHARRQMVATVPMTDSEPC
jgi:hypothetical protein